MNIILTLIEIIVLIFLIFYNNQFKTFLLLKNISDQNIQSINKKMKNKNYTSITFHSENELYIIINNKYKLTSNGHVFLITYYALLVAIFAITYQSIYNYIIFIIQNY